ncbi:asparaginase [Paenactinomyces guangxiensis]|uniref:Asparaginase n=1 Tax=Paenactinomyces guangxiensis TaxID=1490290 RepID=A0A7W1WTW4_9BACL|nr:asparaginase [Paenactinomyces guangxiensis]MBA4495937.1 asparaginase [Paenactinomyces guangxiensis]MBH8593076.1 asparaginase [Paenactinomyces guangxiensis]
MSNVVANVYRGGVIESSHLGHVAVVDKNGSLLYSYGDPNRLTYARSSMKPIQTIPVVETGAADRFAFSEADLALCCASHSGEERHRSRVLAMLSRIGQSETVLQCGTHVPRDEASYRQLIKESRELTPVYSNCSGKHAGMVATAVHMGEDPHTYHEQDHPVQIRILEAVADVTGYPKDKIHIGIDGCGVPAHRLPLVNLAWAFARLATPSVFDNPVRREAVQRVTDAMVAAPEMVGGHNRYCTDLMQAFKGQIIGKAGAEAVYCIGDRQSGIGIAVKIEDGGARATYAVMNEVLYQLGIGTDGELEALHAYTNPDVKNMNGKSVGSIRTEFTLRRERKAAL